MALQLSENEYRLVSIVLVEAPMSPAELNSLAATRLWLEEREASALTEGLLAREVLTLDGDTIVSRVTREEADQAALDRALNGFQPRWPAPNPPPEEESVPEKEPLPEEEPKRPFFRPSNPVLWVIAIALIAAAILCLWLLAERERYPMLTAFEDGRIFIQQAEPENSAQEAAVSYLQGYARDQRWTGTPVFDTFQITAMEEYVTNPKWATAYSTAQLTSSVYNIASSHEGVVVFVTAEHTVTETVPANPYDNGTHIYRIYLTENEDGTWTVAGMECSEESRYTEVSSSTVTVDGREFTVSFLGQRVFVEQSNIYAIWISDGESRQLLYLTEGPDTEGLGIDSQRDINNDGFADLRFLRSGTDTTALCYLYSPEDGTFRLCPELAGTAIITSTSLPGTVQYFSSVEGTSYRHFCRFENGTELVELARQNWSWIGQEDGSMKETYAYYLDGELVRTYDLASPSNAATLTAQILIDQFMPSVYWDELILRAAQENGCLELPQPSYLSSDFLSFSQISLLHWDYENNVAFYTSPSQLLLIRDGSNLQVFPTDAYTWEDTTHYTDLDGDGDKDLLTVTAWMDYPVILWNGEDGWTLEAFDLTAIVTDFNENASLKKDGMLYTVTYDGQYGSTSASSADTYTMVGSQIFGDMFPQELHPWITSANGTDKSFHEDLCFLTISFSVSLREAGTWFSTSFLFNVTLKPADDGSFEVHSVSLSP